MRVFAGTSFDNLVVDEEEIDTEELDSEELDSEVLGSEEALVEIDFSVGATDLFPELVSLPESLMCLNIFGCGVYNVCGVGFVAIVVKFKYV